ncbi:hypothetical protein OESDEN_15906 [Oesophagostomum dentatum]|uniref:Uncharacterized protein n=1 Tax=Oesophagostomum dentatum TaxID=61180 RepID=A0A0B1SLG3_OESDE|nr:hypothetical protein OESDEN_15906 [Oesophagostomum dentatum]
MPLSEDERAAIERVRTAAGGTDHPYCKHEYNVHRWITAYGGDEEEAAKANGGTHEVRDNSPSVAHRLLVSPSYHPAHRLISAVAQTDQSKRRFGNDGRSLSMVDDRFRSDDG